MDCLTVMMLLLNRIPKLDLSKAVKVKLTKWLAIKNALALVLLFVAAVNIWKANNDVLMDVSCNFNFCWLFVVCIATSSIWDLVWKINPLTFPNWLKNTLQGFPMSTKYTGIQFTTVKLNNGVKITLAKNSTNGFGGVQASMIQRLTCTYAILDTTQCSC